eukprot:2019782-Lingulodinium_polyedra.AAC.1
MPSPGPPFRHALALLPGISRLASIRMRSFTDMEYELWPGPVWSSALSYWLVGLLRRTLAWALCVGPLGRAPEWPGCLLWLHLARLSTLT